MKQMAKYLMIAIYLQLITAYYDTRSTSQLLQSTKNLYWLFQLSGYHDTFVLSQQYRNERLLYSNFGSCNVLLQIQRHRKYEMITKRYRFMNCYITISVSCTEIPCIDQALPAAFMHSYYETSQQQHKHSSRPADSHLSHCARICGWQQDLLDLQYKLMVYDVNN